MYTSDTQLRERFGAQEIDGLVGGEASRMDRAVADASGLIDGYLARSYALPLASVPGMVAAWAADIARYKLWDDRAPDEVRKRYEDALSQLKQVSQGIIALPVPTASGEQPAGGFAWGGFSQDRVFTAETLAGY